MVRTETFTVVFSLAIAMVPTAAANNYVWPGVPDIPMDPLDDLLGDCVYLVPGDVVGYLRAKGVDGFNLGNGLFLADDRGDYGALGIYQDQGTQTEGTKVYDRFLILSGISVTADWCDMVVER